MGRDMTRRLSRFCEVELSRTCTAHGYRGWSTYLGTMPLSRDDVALTQFGECAAEQADPSQKNRCACSVLRVRYVSPNEAS